VNRYICLILLMICYSLVIIGPAAADEMEEKFELFTVAGEYFPSSDADNDDPDQGNTEYSFREFQFSTGVPIYISESGLIITNGIGYSYLDIGDEDFPADELFESAERIGELHSLSYNLFMAKPLSEKWSFSTFISLALSSDFEDITFDDVFYNAGLNFNYQQSPNTGLGFGLYIMEYKGGLFAFPGVSIAWDDHDKWSVSTVLPIMFEVWYKASKDLQIGFGSSFSGNEYRLSEKYFKNYKFDRTEYMVGPKLKYNLSESIRMDLELGASIYRRLEILDEDGDEIKSGETKLDPNYYARLGFSFSL
jgi:Domain of unknown function (DUF6268)